LADNHQFIPTQLKDAFWLLLQRTAGR